MTLDDRRSIWSIAVRAIVPALTPSEANDVADSLAALLEKDRPEWLPRAEAAVVQLTSATARSTQIAAMLDADEELRWFSALVNDAHFARPAEWARLGWAPGGPVAYPDPVIEPELRTLDPRTLPDQYDVIVVGSGAGGGIAAQEFAASGRRVLVIERGDFPSTRELAGEILRSPRSASQLGTAAGPDGEGNPRVLAWSGDAVVRPATKVWGNNAMTLGGGTRVYGAQAWRFSPVDFRMATTYGVPDGSALADWPISYEDLEPFYAEIEDRIGVSGRESGDPWAGARSRSLPMPALPSTKSGEILAQAADQLGWGHLPVPLLINSVARHGNAACTRCALCVGFACPVNAKNGSLRALVDAQREGWCDIALRAQAERITVDESNRVNGVSIVGLSGSAVWRRHIRADLVVVAAGAVETARLLLNSQSDREPHGLGNNADQVGRYLQDHIYAGAIGIFDEDVVDLIGPGPSIATADFRHGNRDVIAGGILANEFIPTPPATFRYLVDAGLIPRAGVESGEQMAVLHRRMLRVVGPIHEVTHADSRVRVSSAVVDRFGVPVAALDGAIHPEDRRAQKLMNQRAEEWMQAAGAKRVATNPLAPEVGPSVGQHQAGTCRMGDDPRSSVVDPQGRVWGHDNLLVADGSVHVTNGGVNPVLTIMATALRTSRIATQ